MASESPRVLLLGAGRMGTALLDGWLSKHALKGPPVVLEPTPTSALKARANAGELRLNPQAGANAPEIVVVAVKPQSFAAGFAALKPFLTPKTAILSVAAGKTVASLGAVLGEDRPIVRAMPNTPAAVGRGITVSCANARVTPAQRGVCDGLLAAVGEIGWVEDEALIDAVTAVSGSGPAYVFLLIECMAEAGVAAGLPAELAMRLARATVIGSGELARLSRDPPAVLRQNVTSPGGTTRAALDVLMAPGGLAALMTKAIAAAAARSRELAE